MHELEVELEKSIQCLKYSQLDYSKKESLAHCNRSLTNSYWMVDVLQT